MSSHTVRDIPYPISICVVPASGMVPAILSFHIAATSKYAYSKIVLVYNMSSLLVQGKYTLNDKTIEVQHIRFIEDAYLIAQQLDYKFNLMLWDSNQCLALNPLTSIGASLAIASRSFIKTAAFLFFPDGWVGMSYPSEAQKGFITSHRIPIDNCLQLQLIDSPFLAEQFSSFGLSTLVVDVASVRESLHVCQQFYDRLVQFSDLRSNEAISIPSSNTLFLVMRAWHSKSFHDGLYSFGSDDPIKSVIATIGTSICHAGRTLSSFDTIVICPDTRTNHLYTDEELRRELTHDGCDKVQLLSEYAGSAIPEGLTLDYVLPRILELQDSTVYSFDSNTPVPFYLANISFQSIIGAPVDSLQAHHANPTQVDYIAGNVGRLSYYCSTDYYYIHHDNAFAVVSPK